MWSSVEGITSYIDINLVYQVGAERRARFLPAMVGSLAWLKCSEYRLLVLLIKIKIELSIKDR